MYACKEFQESKRKFPRFDETKRARWSRVLGRVCHTLARNQINSLPNGRDSDLRQIENVFKYPEDGLWEKNSSEGIAGNSEVY